MTRVPYPNKIQEQFAQVLESFELDLFGDPNLIDTPKRWLKFLGHYCQGYNPGEHLSVTFVDAVATEAERAWYGHSLVVQSNIPYRAVCAHHLLPVLGTASVGYIPDKKVVGLSKLSRVVYGFSHAQPSLQEHVTNSVTESLMTHLKPLGAMCVIRAEHGCMGCRGVEEPHVVTSTASVKGVFIEKHEARQEFYELMK